MVFTSYYYNIVLAKCKLTKHQHMNKLQAKNEILINAPLNKIWTAITDINMLPNINPGVIKATGKMDKQGGSRYCEINNNGKKGTMVEKLIELIPEKRTVWSLQSDTMGMTKMLKDVTFVFNLEKMGDNQTRVINETYYKPGNILVAIMNLLIMKKRISKIQSVILENVKRITEK